MFANLRAGLVALVVVAACDGAATAPLSEPTASPGSSDPADPSDPTYSTDSTPSDPSEPSDPSDPGGTTGGGGGGGGGGGACSANLPGETGFGTCGGPGGGLFFGDPETEPNDTSGQPLSLGSPYCGDVDAGDVDRFEYTASAGACLVVSFDSVAASIVVSGAGVSESGAGAETFKFQTGSDGTLVVEITAASPDAYEVTLR